MFDLGRAIGKGVRERITLPPNMMEQYGHQAVNRAVRGGAIAGLGALGINALTGRPDGSDDINVLAAIAAGSGIGAASTVLGQIARRDLLKRGPTANQAAHPSAPSGIQQKVAPITAPSPTNAGTQVPALAEQVSTSETLTPAIVQEIKKSGKEKGRKALTPDPVAQKSEEAIRAAKEASGAFFGV